MGGYCLLMCPNVSHMSSYDGCLHCSAPRVRLQKTLVGKQTLQTDTECVSFRTPFSGMVTSY